MQRDLFGNIVLPALVEPKETYQWSHSKINALDSCPRKYFYAYYGGKKRSALQQVQLWAKSRKIDILESLTRVVESIFNSIKNSPKCRVHRGEFL